MCRVYMAFLYHAYYTYTCKFICIIATPLMEACTLLVIIAQVWESPRISPSCNNIS